MSFAECNTFWGGTDVEAADPEISVIDDCVYVPFDEALFFDRDAGWGIYDSHGTLVEAAAYRRGPTGQLVGQSDSIQLSSRSINDAPDVEYMYCGPIIPHYGHFILSTLSRLWPIVAMPPKSWKFVCHSDFDMHDHFTNPYIGPIFSALGLTADDFVRFRHPTRIRRLTIPHPSFVEQKKANAVFAELCHRVGDALTLGQTVSTDKRPVYLSKSRIGVGGVSHIENERALEPLLLSAKIDVCYPEELTLSDQIGLFKTRSTVVGFTGSNFHTHIFCRTPPRMIEITLDPYINSNLILLDAINKAEVIYRFPDGNIKDGDSRGFIRSRSIINMDQFVDDISDAILEFDQTGHYREIVLSSDENTASVLSIYNEHCARDHGGENYRSVMARIHGELKPKSYLEIGSLDGGTLRLASCASIAVDPEFKISQDVVGSKPSCLLFQMTSDDFFSSGFTSRILGEKIDFAFLDGMHRCEYLLRDFANTERYCRRNSVIALHDCVPLESPMTDRVQNASPPIAPHRAGWWTGDVWRTLLVLRQRRPDLRILSLDAEPTGLVLITNLNPESNILRDDYASIVEEMMSFDLSKITIESFFMRIDLQPTSVIGTPDRITSRFWL